MYFRFSLQKGIAHSVNVLYVFVHEYYFAFLCVLGVVGARGGGHSRTGFAISGMEYLFHFGVSKR